jgi:hypothetical protein
MIKQFLDSLKEKLEKSRLTAVAISLGAFVFLFALSFTRPYELFDLKLYDLNFNAKPSIPQWDGSPSSISTTAPFTASGSTRGRGTSTPGALDVLGRVGARQAVFRYSVLEESSLLVDRKAMRAWRKDQKAAGKRRRDQRARS